jgi:hypothetical protein
LWLIIFEMADSTTSISIACFVTPHGFGHAARACAVIEALHAKLPEARFEIYTQAPAWLFFESLPRCYTYHDYACDVGLVQPSPFVEDLPATILGLEEVYPPRPGVVDRLAHEITGLGCRLVLCDIAPLGIAVARAASLPSILIENFTWDWIYEGYLSEEPRFSRFIPLLHDLLTAATYHIQTEPICVPDPCTDLSTGPVSRLPHRSRPETHSLLGVPEGARCVLVSMGGIPLEQKDLMPFTRSDGIYFVIPGGSDHFEKQGNLVLLPHHTPIYHPDLVMACDVLIGKAGYSTVAEAYYAGVPFGFVSRPRFREAGPVAAFIKKEMNGIEIREDTFQDGSWVRTLNELLTQPRQQPDQQNGSIRIAEFLSNLILPSSRFA